MCLFAFAFGTLQGEAFDSSSQVMMPANYDDGIAAEVGLAPGA